MPLISEECILNTVYIMVHCVKCGSKLTRQDCWKCGMKSMAFIPKQNPDKVYDPKQWEYIYNIEKPVTFWYRNEMTSLKVENGSKKIGFYEDRVLKWKVTEYIKVTYPTNSQKHMDISYTDGNKNKIRRISSDYFNHIIEFLDDQVNAHKLFYSDFADSYIIYKAVMTMEEVEYLTKHSKYLVYGGE
jgi:hypothetical protein